jgi:single-strand DNA-binding protein
LSELITISGLVATTPRHLVTQDGLPITSFRLASSQRRFDRNQNRWIDGETNWYTVTSFRQLAINTSESVNKGDRIVVTGKLRVRDWDNGERSGTSVEIDADAIGHDLSWGTATFVRTILVRETDPADEGAMGDGFSTALSQESGTADDIDDNGNIKLNLKKASA